VLEVVSVHYSYGGVRALRETSVRVDRGEVVCLLGMNGAGKTTLLSLISGLIRPDRGRILFEDRLLSRLDPSRIVEAGVVQVPEGRQLFAPLTVLENLRLGAYLRSGKREREAVHRDIERALTLFPPLATRLKQKAGTLSGGEQQMLAVARGLMASPKLLLLDEPSLGLAPKIAAEIFRVIQDLPRSGCSALLVEQNALGALAVARRGYIITNGRIRFEGTSEEILKDRFLREAFLGPERVLETEDS